MRSKIAFSGILFYTLHTLVAQIEVRQNPFVNTTCLAAMGIESSPFTLRTDFYRMNTKAKIYE